MPEREGRNPLLTTHRAIGVSMQIADRPDVIVPIIKFDLTGEAKFRHCKACGGVKAVLTEKKEFYSGSGVHAGGFRCSTCGHHLGWLTQTEVSLLKAGG